jgi:DNA-binding response OmpR family regulator
MEVRELGDLLVAAEAVSADQWARIREALPVVGEGVVRTRLVQVAQKHEKAICDILAARQDAPVLVFGQSTLDLIALDLVPAAVVNDFGLLPVSFDGDVLTLAAIADDEAMAKRIAAATGCRVLLVGAIPDLLRATTATAQQARAKGERVLVGPGSTNPRAHLVFARPPPPAADDVARELDAILSEALDLSPPKPTAPSSPTSSQSDDAESPTKAPSFAARMLGALRLKQVRTASPRSPSSSSAPSPEPKPPPSPDFVELLPPPEGTGPRALVVEDDDAIRALLVRILRTDGLLVEAAGDSNTALALLRRRRPDIVLLDAMLPGIYGFDICSTLKKSEAWSTVPVVMISAVFRGFDNAKLIQEIHGADAFLEKPFDVRHLRHVVATLLQRPLAPPARTAVVEQACAKARTQVEQAQQANDPRRAMEGAKLWIDADPFDAEAWLALGRAQVVDDPFAALHAYERAASFGGTLFIAQVTLATTYERFGFLRRARATWTRAAECAPDENVAQRIRTALAAWR